MCEIDRCAASSYKLLNEDEDRLDERKTKAKEERVNQGKRVEVRNGRQTRGSYIYWSDKRRRDAT